MPRALLCLRQKLAFGALLFGAPDALRRARRPRVHQGARDRAFRRHPHGVRDPRRRAQRQHNRNPLDRALVADGSDRGRPDTCPGRCLRLRGGSGLGGPRRGASCATRSSSRAAISSAAAVVAGA
eukprot:Amastigsp_a849552_7.p4 type:complete len:125 gc:universal Amastigsp_a849552_7:646-272(-)